MSIATPTLSPAEKLPKQTKLLGATVKGLGLVVAVSKALFMQKAYVKYPTRNPFSGVLHAVLALPKEKISYETQSFYCSAYCDFHFSGVCGSE